MSNGSRGSAAFLRSNGMIVSTNPNIRTLVSQAMTEYPWLRPEKGRRHWRLRSQRSQDFVLIPFSPSDRRVVKHLHAQIRRLAEHGRGFIDGKRH
jgi:hypothetical protein